MKSTPYKLQGKLFRYDFDNGQVEYIYKASAEDRKDEEEWIAEHGRPLFGIDEFGYIILDTVGLRKENWTNKAARNEYLLGWIADIDAESAALARDFEKYELPALLKEMEAQNGKK